MMDKKELNNEVLKDVVGGQQKPVTPPVIKAYINQSICVSCGACDSYCPEDGAIVCDGRQYKINPVKCRGQECGECMSGCPACAIYWKATYM